MHAVPTSLPGARTDLTLLIWDVPNINRTLSALFRDKDRLRREAKLCHATLMDWLLDRAGSGPVEAVAFMNATDQAGFGPKRNWANKLLRGGYGVFVMPKKDGEGDVDDAMLDVIEARRPLLREVVIMSHDRRNFGAIAEDLAVSGVRVTPLVLKQFAGWPDATTPEDLAAVPGLFESPLPLTLGSFDDLPPGGRFFPPLVAPTRSKAVTNDEPLTLVPSEPAEPIQEPVPEPVPAVLTRRQREEAFRVIAIDVAKDPANLALVSDYGPWWGHAIGRDALDPVTIAREAIAGTEYVLADTEQGPAVYLRSPDALTA